MPLLQDGRSIFEENSFNSQFRVKREKLYYYKKNTDPHLLETIRGNHPRFESF